MNLSEIVIVSAVRTPIGRFQGAYQQLSATDLGAMAAKAALAQAAVPATEITECLMGNVVSAGLGQAPARQVALAAGLPMSVGATTINKVCGSGMKTVMLAAAQIRTGEATVVLAGGMESMSQAPYLLPQVRAGHRLGHSSMVDALIHDGLWCAIEHQHMGNAAEWIAQTQQIERSAQDAYALRSHERAIAAQDAGLFAAEIAPVTIQTGRGQTTVITHDEPPRRDTSLPQLAKLKPAFDPHGTVTAGNAPGLTDGAAAVVVTSIDYAVAYGIRPLARLTGVAQVAVPPAEVFTAPVFAIQKLMQQTRTTLDDYDLFEINEAFAAQVVANGRALGLDWDRLNVHGGAIALGHPIGASGTRVIVTLIHALRQRGGSRGLASLCLGGGEAVALALELI